MNSKVFFEEIQQHFNNAKPFVLYRKPRELQMQAMLQKDKKRNIINDYSESGFVFSPFDDSEQAVLIPVSESESLKAEYTIEKEESNRPEPSRKVHSLDMEAKIFHVDLVQKCIDAIANTDLQKVVLSRCEVQDISDESPIEIFKRLLDRYPTAFVYCWYHPQVGLWLGATPETLLKVQGNRFSTMALAGTQLYKETENVVWQEKEKVEQQIVTEFIANSLQSCVSSIKISKVETVKAGNLLHLKTAISGILDVKTSSFKQVLQTLHPTPAVCGFPKESAKLFILQNENYNRTFYSGFLGELNIKENKTRNTNRRNVENNAYASVKTVSNLYVNLRCVQLKNKQAFLYVGGGVTKDSVAENEWQETVNKTQTIQAVLD